MYAKSLLSFRTLVLAIVVCGVPQFAQASEAVEGKLVADQRGHISAQMTGERSQRVKDLYVRVGDSVKKGDKLALLDTEQLEADRLIAQRALEEAQSAVEVAKSNVTRAQLDYDRRAGLKGSPSFNRAAFEDAEVALRAAESALQSAQSSAKRRDAEVARIGLEIRLAEINAPYDGLVVDVLTNAGASVTQRAPDLLTLLDLNQVEIAVPVSQSTAQSLLLGQSVGYSLASGENRTARVRAVVPQGTAFVARLQLDSTADLPLGFRHEQPVQVYLEKR